MPLPVNYGIWIPSQGWLRANNEPVAFDRREVAEETASRIGMKSQVRYIDTTLVDLEPNFLSLEKERSNLFSWKRMFIK